jgi:hypothetical protein
VIIKLTSIPAYYINLEGGVERREKTEGILNTLGFHTKKRLPGFPHENSVMGCGLAHQNALDSLKTQDLPFILFEDDIELTHFDHILDIPDDADALYLGVSKMGVIDGKDEEMLIVDTVDGYPHLYRIYNMLAAHAIVYLNMDYVKELAEATQSFIDRGLPVDLGMAQHMANGKVYALDKPMFIQSPKFRYFTDTPISKLNNVTFKSK